MSVTIRWSGGVGNGKVTAFPEAERASIYEGGKLLYDVVGDILVNVSPGSPYVVEMPSLRPDDHARALLASVHNATPKYLEALKRELRKFSLRTSEWTD